MKEQIFQKLTSRKLWAAIAAVIITVATALLNKELSPETVDLLSKGVVALCCYIFGEGIVDAARQISTYFLGSEFIIEDELEKDDGE